ncbi:MAG: DNA pilot protein [Microvirus sp.]|nr:MAG: DNA pilot protein [Microvirus sp.]
MSLHKQRGFLAALAPFAPAIATAFGAAMGLKGASDQNKASAYQAATQMDFQERMSNTAHQREVRDLRAAGLNPVLSGTGGMGASSPSGAAAPVVNELGAAVDSGAKAAATTSLNQVQSAQIENIQAQTRLSSAQAQEAQARADILTKQRYGDGRTTLERNMQAESDYKQYESEAKMWEPRLKRYEYDLLKEEISNAKHQGRNIQANTGNTNVDTALKKIAEKYGDLRQLTGAAGEIISSATGLRRLTQPAQGLRRR